MSPAAEEVWAILKEVAQAQKETERKFQETERKFQETERKFQETERLMQESSRKLDIKIEKTMTAIGRLGNRLGDFVEEAVKPSAIRLLLQRGIEVHVVYQNITAQRDNEVLEVDLLAVNDSVAVAIECKSNLGIDDVKEHLERLAKFKWVLPNYADSKLMGAVAAMVIPDNVARYAYRQGLFVIGQTGDHLDIRNDNNFVPKTW
jgi:hypothetical protein